MKKIKVLIVDDHAILRDGLHSLLERQPDIQVVGEAGDGLEAIAKVSELFPDVVLMDIAMPEMNGIEATRQICNLFPEIKILILTQHNYRDYIGPLISAGASGYVLKRSGGREVITAIRQVWEHGIYLEPGITLEMVEKFKNPGAGDTEYDGLTDREREVLELTAIGRTNKEIAQILKISPKTVSVHRTHIMEKLGVQNNFELLQYLNRRQGLSDGYGLNE